MAMSKKDMDKKKIAKKEKMGELEKLASAGQQGRKEETCKGNEEKITFDTFLLFVLR